MIEKSIFHYRAAAVLLFINTFLIGAVFRYRQFTGAGMDYQIVMKLIASLAGIAYAVVFYRMWVARMIKIDGIMIALMTLWFFVACLYAPVVSYSLASAVTFASIIMLAYVAVEVVDPAEVIAPIIWACGVIAIVSLVVFFVNPDFGRGKAWVNGQHVPGFRLRGITGAANGMGYIAAFCCLLIYCHRVYLSPRLPWIYGVFFAVSVVALVMSDSRSSLGALILAAGVGYLQKLTPARLAGFFCAICLAMVMLAAVDINSLLSMVSRSGDASEVLTGTGRTEIWSQVFPMIAQKPVFGWGFASTGFLMPSLDHSTPHAHNMFLQVLFMTGAIGLALTIPAIFIKMYYAVKFEDQVKISLMVFMLIQGLTEAAAFRGTASVATIALALVFAMPYINTVRRPAGQDGVA